jgi:hypothetical protein
MSLNTHTYDPYYKEIFESRILPLLPKLNSIEIDREWISILQESKKHPLDIQSSVFQTYRCNDLDTNLTRNGYDCHLLGAQVWILIKNNSDSRQVFLEQFRDMNTGRCAQGQSNRYLQVLNAFYKS